MNGLDPRIAAAIENYRITVEDTGMDGVRITRHIPDAGWHRQEIVVPRSKIPAMVAELTAYLASYTP